MATKTCRGKSPAQDLVRQLRADGLSDERARAQLKAKGFSKSRISQLLRGVPHQCRVEGNKQTKKRGAASDGRRKVFEEFAPAKKRGPPLALDELRQFGEASALKAAREFTQHGSYTLARLSCQYLGVSTGPYTYSSVVPVRKNSTLVYAWRLAANGLERVALARTSARADAMNKYVPLPDRLKNILHIDAHYDKVRAEAQRAFPATTFNLRLGMPRKLEPPPHPYAPGAAVMIRFPSGKRAEHVLCAHVSGSLWYCHAGSPKDGELSITEPFRITDLVVQDLANSWRPLQAHCKRRKRLQGRCIKRNLAATAVQHRDCFERVVAKAKWDAEAFRAKQRGVPMHLAAATVGVDFSEEAFKTAAASPWTSTVLAVWQWAAPAPLDRPPAHLCPDSQMCYALRSATYRSFCSCPREVLPCVQTVSG